MNLWEGVYDGRCQVNELIHITADNGMEDKTSAHVCVGLFVGGIIDSNDIIKDGEKAFYPHVTPADAIFQRHSSSTFPFFIISTNTCNLPFLSPSSSS